MNTSPIDSWEGVSEFFPWGPGSFGVWLFVILSVLLFVGMIAFAIRHENETGAELVKRVRSESAAADGAVAAADDAVAATVGQ